MDDIFRHSAACLFDLDGVLTPTAELHQIAWSRLFTPFLARYRDVVGYRPKDYFTLIDARPRYDGVRAVLADRGIDLPEGHPSDPASLTSVCGLGNWKDDLFHQTLASQPIQPYPGSLRLVRHLSQRSLPLAVVSASHNARTILASAGLTDFFPVVIDGDVTTAARLQGKPAPDSFLAAAQRLGVEPRRTAVIEDALSGVTAGRAGGFHPVIGVDRGAGAVALTDHGATIVVEDLAELIGEKP